MGTARSSPDLADGMDCVDCAAYFTPWTNWRQSGPTFSEQPPFFPRSSEPLLLACCFFLFLFLQSFHPAVLSPNFHLTTFVLPLMSPITRLTQASALISLASWFSHLSLSLLSPLGPPLPSCSRHFPSCLTPSHRTAIDGHQVKIQQIELTNRQYRNYDCLCISRFALH